MIKNVKFPSGAMLALAILAGLNPAQAEPLEPFTFNAPPPSRTVKPGKAEPIVLDCLDAAKSPGWSVEEIGTATDKKAFALEKVDGADALRIFTEAFSPRTTLRMLLPGEGPANGDAWVKAKASYVSFLAKSTKPAEMSFHLLQRGKSAGTFTAKFPVKPGEWQTVILPMQQFGLKNFAKIAGLGFRVASAEPGTEVFVKDVKVGATPFTDDSWRAHRDSASLKGGWHFATDSGDQGEKGKWYESAFDDSVWQILQSGSTWQSQGVPHKGYAWYRQKLTVPKELEGSAITLNLADIPADDDVWFNGVRVGGLHSGYEYSNQALRTYIVPASIIRYGEPNTIAVRAWGGNIGFDGEKSGLVAGTYRADVDPYRVMMREPGGTETPAELFDLSDAQRGKPFELVFRFPGEVATGPLTLECTFQDFYGKKIGSATAPLAKEADGIARAVVKVDSELAQTIYLRGRFKADLVIKSANGDVVYFGSRDLDHLSFASRDEKSLPMLSEVLEDTPYGKLKLVDEIDAATPLSEEIHPYLQSGFEKAQAKNTPGSAVDVRVSDILGKKARESEYGWFAYKIGRGKLKPHTNYLLRIEYPEDQPRYVPIELQIGQNYMDVGYESGLTPDDPYAPWPLSKGWHWYDTMVSLDDETVGAGGTGSASADNGFWVYFMNKIKPKVYFSMYGAGPAVARIKLYEIDPEKNAPVINLPKDLPHRVLMFDWERQPESDPADMVRYGKLMGYNAISPVIMKWHSMNFGDPLNGYDSTNIDDRGYWVRNRYDKAGGKPVGPAVEGKSTVHAKYLEATKRYGLNYVPRFEYGGSEDLPLEARAIAGNGEPAKPNRFHQWCSDLLHPATFQDITKLLDMLAKPYAKDNPQLTGMLWRIRCDRMPVSYSRFDLDLFSKETGVKLPEGSDKDLAAWASTGEGRKQYDDWWSKKRAEFHGKVAELLRSYNPDMRLYYYNWDGDKFSLGLPSLTAWAFLGQVAGAKNGDGHAVYVNDREERKKLTAQDYIKSLQTGDFGLAAKNVDRVDYALRPELYRDIKGVELFAPANQLCFADSPEYLNYFKTAEGVAVSNPVVYDEVAARTINPKYEGNMITPGGAAFSMAFELMSYFHSDARTLTYTVYTYGRGFADAHRRFAQAFLALPAIPGTVVENADKDLKVRTYPSANGTYVGVAYKGFAGKKLTIKVPDAKEGMTVQDLVTNQKVPATFANNELAFEVESGPMELNAYLVK